MQLTPVDTLRAWHSKAHRDFLAAAEALSEDQLLWRPHPRELPAAWHIWHIGRFADFSQALLRGEDQVWHRESLLSAWRWNLAPEELGRSELGTGMDQAVACALTWPETQHLFDYARRVIGDACEAFGLVTPENFNDEVPGAPTMPGVISTYGDYLTRFTWHAGRHLGVLDLLGSESAAA